MVAVLFVDDDTKQLDSFNEFAQTMELTYFLANSGEEALRLLAENPDIGVAVVDFNMPNMNGVELLSVLHTQFPLVQNILCTASSEYKMAKDAVKAGKVGHIINKPYSVKDLMSSVTESIADHQALLAAQLNHKIVKEKDKADFKLKMLIDRIIHMGCIKEYPQVKYHLKQMEAVGGDMILTVKLPDNKLRIFVGDITNHGAHAAVAGIDIANSFYDLHKANPNIDKSLLLSEINKHFNVKMPANYFCCTAFAEIDFETKEAHIWLGGIPSVYIKRQNGEIEEIEANHLAIGIQKPELFETNFKHVTFNLGDQLYLWTDGIFETKNKAGEMFGMQALMQTFEANQNPDALFQAILDDCRNFLGLGVVDDDMTLVEVRF
jgi:FixJ family two-component response regulator